ncbi:MAG: SDR family NAD(P)-dependent oxidoreductase [Planctomycetota bacterium]
MSDTHPTIDLPGIRQFRMDDQVALITGGSKGLGTAIAAGLASAGASIVIAARGLEEARLAASQISAQYGVAALAVSLDVTDPTSVEATVQRTLSDFGRLDVLINSAGINIRGNIESLSYEQFQAVQKTNVDGTWLCCKAVVPHMKSSGYGRIVNIASTLGIVGLANRTPYTASKGAIVTMTRALGLELARTGVTCNALCPGPFLTPMNIPIADSEEARRNIVGATAMERWGNLSEIQGAALLLASPASSYMTGSLITVDGGWTAR